MVDMLDVQRLPLPVLIIVIACIVQQFVRIAVAEEDIASHNELSQLFQEQSTGVLCHDPDEGCLTAGKTTIPSDLFDDVQPNNAIKTIRQTFDNGYYTMLCWVESLMIHEFPGNDTSYVTREFSLVLETPATVSKNADTKFEDAALKGISSPRYHTFEVYNMNTKKARKLVFKTISETNDEVVREHKIFTCGAGPVLQKEIKIWPNSERRRVEIRVSPKRVKLEDCQVKKLKQGESSDNGQIIATAAAPEETYQHIEKGVRPDRHPEDLFGNKHEMPDSVPDVSLTKLEGDIKQPEYHNPVLPRGDSVKQPTGELQGNDKTIPQDKFSPETSTFKDNLHNGKMPDYDYYDTIPTSMPTFPKSYDESPFVENVGSPESPETDIDNIKKNNPNEKGRRTISNILPHMDPVESLDKDIPSVELPDESVAHPSQADTDQLPTSNQRYASNGGNRPPHKHDLDVDQPDSSDDYPERNKYQQPENHSDNPKIPATKATYPHFNGQYHSEQNFDTNTPAAENSKDPALTIKPDHEYDKRSKYLPQESNNAYQSPELNAHMPKDDENTEKLKHPEYTPENLNDDDKIPKNYPHKPDGDWKSRTHKHPEDYPDKLGNDGDRLKYNNPEYTLQTPDDYDSPAANKQLKKHPQTPDNNIEHRPPNPDGRSQPNESPENPPLKPDDNLKTPINLHPENFPNSHPDLPLNGKRRNSNHGPDNDSSTTIRQPKIYYDQPSSSVNIPPSQNLLEHAIATPAPNVIHRVPNAEKPDGVVDPRESMPKDTHNEPSAENPLENKPILQSSIGWGEEPGKITSTPNKNDRLVQPDGGHRRSNPPNASSSDEHTSPLPGTFAIVPKDSDNPSPVNKDVGVPHLHEKPVQSNVNGIAPGNLVNPQEPKLQTDKKHWPNLQEEPGQPSETINNAHPAEQPSSKNLESNLDVEHLPHAHEPDIKSNGIEPHEPVNPSGVVPQDKDEVKAPPHFGEIPNNSRDPKLEYDPKSPISGHTTDPTGREVDDISPVPVVDEGRTRDKLHPESTTKPGDSLHFTKNPSAPLDSFGPVEEQKTDTLTPNSERPNSERRSNHGDEYLETTTLSPSTTEGHVGRPKPKEDMSMLTSPIITERFTTSPTIPSTTGVYPVTSETLPIGANAGEHPMQSTDIPQTELSITVQTVTPPTGQHINGDNVPNLTYTAPSEPQTTIVNNIPKSNEFPVTDQFGLVKPNGSEPGHGFPPERLDGTPKDRHPGAENPQDKNHFPINTNTPRFEYSPEVSKASPAEDHNKPDSYKNSNTKSKTPQENLANLPEMEGFGSDHPRESNPLDPTAGQPNSKYTQDNLTPEEGHYHPKPHSSEPELPQDTDRSQQANNQPDAFGNYSPENKNISPKEINPESAISPDSPDLHKIIDGDYRPHDGSKEPNVEGDGPGAGLSHKHPEKNWPLESENPVDTSKDQAIKLNHEPSDHLPNPHQKLYNRSEINLKHSPEKLPNLTPQDSSTDHPLSEESRITLSGSPSQPYDTSGFPLTTPTNDQKHSNPNAPGDDKETNVLVGNDGTPFMPDDQNETSTENGHGRRRNNDEPPITNGAQANKPFLDPYDNNKHRFNGPGDKSDETPSLNENNQPNTSEKDDELSMKQPRDERQEMCAGTPSGLRLKLKFVVEYDKQPEDVPAVFQDLLNLEKTIVLSQLPEAPPANLEQLAAGMNWFNFYQLLEPYFLTNAIGTSDVFVKKPLADEYSTVYNIGLKNVEYCNKMRLLQGAEKSEINTDARIVGELEGTANGMIAGSSNRNMNVAAESNDAIKQMSTEKHNNHRRSNSGGNTFITPELSASGSLGAGNEKFYYHGNKVSNSNFAAATSGYSRYYYEYPKMPRSQASGGSYRYHYDGSPINVNSNAKGGHMIKKEYFTPETSYSNDLHQSYGPSGSSSIIGGGGVSGGGSSRSNYYASYPQIKFAASRENTNMPSKLNFNAKMGIGGGSRFFRSGGISTNPSTVQKIEATSRFQ